MEHIRIKSYGKINLSLDVRGRMDNGYHRVEMVMHGIELHDIVKVAFAQKSSGGVNIKLNVDKNSLPKDERNIAYAAAMRMSEIYPEISGDITVDIKKEIPIGAGLAGGSGNGAAVILALNELWNLDLPIEKLMDLGAGLGADVPFSIMIQACKNNCIELKHNISMSTAALAVGTGTSLQAITALGGDIVLINPGISVSTREVYEGIDSCDIAERPDNLSLIEAVKCGSFDAIKKNMVNVLELYTLNRYSIVNRIKSEILDILGKDAPVLMTGSGPTVYVLTRNESETKSVFNYMKNRYPAVFVSKLLK